MVVDNKLNDYDPFIDFLKAYAIICVLLAHSLSDEVRHIILFPLWGMIAIPLFFLIQSYHVFKKQKISINLRKFTNKYLAPFIIFQFLIITLLITVKGVTIDIPFVKEYIKGGGLGPGSYFIWIYFQFYLLLPIIHNSIINLSKKQLLLIFLSLSVVCDVICSITDIPEWLYRLLPIRFFFLIYLAIIWVRDGVSITTKKMIASVISIAATLLFMDRPQGLEPLFPGTDLTTYRWICYFYIAYLYMWAMKKIYKWISKREWILSFVSKIGKSSYEIYLVQMLVFFYIPTIYPKLFGTQERDSCLVLLIGLVPSLFGGIILKKLLNRLKNA